MSHLVIGIDIGTTHTKGVVIDTGGTIVAEASREATLISYHPTWAEEDPEQWWENTTAIIREFLATPEIQADDIVAVGVSGMVPAMVLLDDAGMPIRLSIQQNDARSGPQVRELAASFSQETFFRRTGGSINQQVIAPKMRWLAKHEPDAVARLATLMGSYDYINFRLTGQRTIEENWALESGLYDITERAWGDDLLALAGLRRDDVAPIVSSSDVVGTITPDAAKATGLLPGTPVAGGAADHVASAYVTTAFADGDLVVKFGGAGDVLYCQKDLTTDPRLFIDHHLIPDWYFLNGCMATSGSLVKWFVENLARDAVHEARATETSVFENLDLEAARVPSGSLGLVVLPYFLGEKTPIHDPDARGTIVGLGLHHTRSHLYRAVLESVAFGFRHHVDVLAERGLPVHRVLAADGGAKSDLWMQITADILQRPLCRLVRHPGSSLGVAVAAGIAVGAFADWSAVDDFVELSEPFMPDPGNAAVYDRNYRVYRTTYERLKDVYPVLSHEEERP